MVLLLRSTNWCSRPWVGAALLAGAISAFSLSAEAQSASEKAAAEALFDEGVKLLKNGQIEAACEKLERSQSVDPGIGTLLYLGECYRQAGRSASAWATFREAASKAEAVGETDRARAGTKKADELAPSLSRITFAVDPANLQIEGLSIRHGDATLNRALWGTAVPVDPGQLLVEVSAPGYESYQSSIEVTPGPSAQELSIPALLALPETAEEHPVAEEPPPAILAVAPEDIDRPLSTRRTVALAFGGSGLVGLGVGGVFGMMALLNEKKAQEDCDGSSCTFGSDGVSYSNKANDFATVSTIGFIAGGALLATGLVLYYTAPKAGQTAKMELTPRWGGATLAMGSTF